MMPFPLSHFYSPHATDIGYESVSFPVRFTSLLLFRLGSNYDPALKQMCRDKPESSLRVDAITHRSEKPILFSGACAP